MNSALYAGVVTHQRLAPKRHYLRYRLFQMLIDLDEAPALSSRLRLFSHNRFNWFSFHDRDHGDGRARLRDWVDETLNGAGLPIEGGQVMLLCMPRMLGHVFNPLSIYYCHRADGGLAAMLYEVNNTFGQRHSYVIPVTDPEGAPVRQSCDKAFHVSPFLGMNMSYDFKMTRPGQTLTTVVNGLDADGALIIAAAFTGRQRPLTDAALARAVLAYPLMTLKVVAAIHLEAVRLFAKGLRLHPQPSQNRQTITLTDGRAL